MFKQILNYRKITFLIIIAIIISASMLPGVSIPANASEAPTITSPNSTIFTVGTSGSFTVTATGDPPPNISCYSELPQGVNFVDNTSLIGTPAAGTGGLYLLTFTATNTAGTANQSFTLTVNQAPAITAQPVNQTVNAGQTASFTATASGYPVPTVQWQLSSTPASIWSNIDGAITETYTTLITNTSMTGYQYRAVFTNSAGMATTSPATLTVNAVPVAPTITSADSATFTEGLAGSFTVTAIGTPAPSISYSGNLPAGVTFGNTSLSGTPAAGSADSYPLVFTATNTAGTANQSFTLTVYQSLPPLMLSIVVPPTIGGSVDEPLAKQPVIKVTDSGGNPLEGIAVVASRNSGTGTLRGHLTATTAANGLAVFTDLGYNKSGEIFTIQFTSGNLSINSNSLGPLNPGMATNIRVESASNGGGNIIPTQNMTMGISLTVYGIARDQYGNYVGNPSNTSWSLSNKTGGIADADLSATSGSSIIFTGHQAGSAVINASVTGLTSINSGTITVTYPASSGGGGGGGSGPTLVINPVIISGFTPSADLEVDPSGRVQSAVQLKLDEGNLILDIPKNAQLIDANSKILETITGSKLSPLLSSPKGSVIITAYELGPDGAQFNPPLTLTIKYDPQSIPQEADGGKITLGFWDGNKWVMEDSTLDTASNTLTAKISHFSQYALLAPLAPAKFTLSELNISQDTAADSPVTIQTVVTNTGGSSGVYTAIFKLNGAEINKKDVMLEIGKNETVSFILKNLIPGKYSVEIGDKTGQFSVSEPNNSSPVSASSPQSAVTSSVPAPVPTSTAAASSPSPVSQPTPHLHWIQLGVFIVAALVTVIILFLRKRGKHA